MEIEFIPIQLYTPIYWYAVILFALAVTVQFLAEPSEQYENSVYQSRNNQLGYLLAVFSVVLIGFRPVHRVFVDMGGYARAFELLQAGSDSKFKADPGFSVFISVCSQLINVRFFFVLCALIYVVPIFLASKKWSPNHWQFLFVAFLGSFEFWGYAVNGIRNGLATSILLFAFSCSLLWPRIVFTLLAISFHKSVALPAAGFYLASRFSPKWFFGFWLLSIPFSLILGSFWESLFSNLGFVDKRIDMYITSSVQGQTYTETGFRFDFLIYGASGVAAGFFYVFKMGFEDLLYNRILGAFLFSNAIWILVIRADFSNRFAYLSWFVMAFVIFYPLLKAKILQNQPVWTGLLLVLYCLFSAYMVILR